MGALESHCLVLNVIIPWLYRGAGAIFQLDTSHLQNTILESAGMVHFWRLVGAPHQLLVRKLKVENHRDLPMLLGLASIGIIIMILLELLGL